MTDIFLSYSSHDRELAREMAAILYENGWSVWWDRTILVGKDWNHAIRKALTEAKVIIVLWTTNAMHSDWVNKEAKNGFERKKLINILLENIQINKNYLKFQAANLADWKGNQNLAEFKSLIEGLKQIVKPSQIDKIKSGYKQNFLDDEILVSLPEVSDALAVLKYLHFTIVMHPGRRLAHYAAYNIDGNRFVELPSHTRQWRIDPLIPKTLQMDVNITKDSDFHRGHLISPITICWGDKEEAEGSGRQANYLTNITPQLGEVNIGSWFKLEDWERHTAKKYGKAIGFSGPVFSSKDKKFRGEILLEEGLVAKNTFSIPQYFWKVVVVKSDKNKNGIAYRSFVVENKKESTYRKSINAYKASLKDVEKISGKKFSEIIHLGTILK